MVVEMSSLFADHDMQWFETQYDARLDPNEDGIKSLAAFVHGKTPFDIPITIFHDVCADMDILLPPSPTFLNHNSKNGTNAYTPTRRRRMDHSMNNNFHHNRRHHGLSVEQIAHTETKSQSIPCDDYEPYTYDECMQITDCGLASFVSESGSLDSLISAIDGNDVDKQQVHDEKMGKYNHRTVDLCYEEDDMTMSSCDDNSSEADDQEFSDEDLMNLQSEPWLHVEKSGPDDCFTVAYKKPLSASIARRHFGVHTVTA